MRTTNSFSSTFMNFLSHHAVAQMALPNAPPLFFVGNVLPDLFATSGEGRLRERTTATWDSWLARGTRLHHATDKRFHSHPDFVEAMAHVSVVLRDAPFSFALHRVFFLAHVFVEIALDGWLLQTRGSTLADDFYVQFTQADLVAVVEETGEWRGAETPLLNLAATLERFAQHRYLYQYATSDGQAEALHRVARRVGLRGFESQSDRSTLATCFELFQKNIAVCAATLLSPPDALNGPFAWYNVRDETKRAATGDTTQDASRDEEREDERADRND